EVDVAAAGVDGAAGRAGAGAAARGSLDRAGAGQAGVVVLDRALGRAEGVVRVEDAERRALADLLLAELHLGERGQLVAIRLAGRGRDGGRTGVRRRLREHQRDG